MVSIFHSSTEGCCLIGGGGDSKGNHNGEGCVVKISEPRAGAVTCLGKPLPSMHRALGLILSPAYNRHGGPVLSPSFSGSRDKKTRSLVTFGLLCKFKVNLGCMRLSKIYPYIRRSTPHVAVCAWDQSSGLLPAACTAESLLWLVALFSNVLHEVFFLNISVLEKPAPCRMLCLHTHILPLN